MMPKSLNGLSRLGIGTYRMCLNNQENEKALIKALTKHINNHNNTSTNKDNKIINVIDTSTNYCDGGSEELIGKVVSSHDKEKLSRDEICIASKFGYCQGQNLTLYHNGHFKNIPNDHIVRYSPNCYHCIHPIFMRDQLNRSLNRLQTKYIDIWFIHNPEYYLMNNIHTGDNNVKVYQKKMLDRIGETFVALEEAVSTGLIRSYGISSNSFSVPPEDKHFLPFEDLIERAKNASRFVRGTEKHGFAAIQLPGNLLEQYGLRTTAKWAKENGLKVFINRPLNAFNDEGGFRLASYPKPKYEEIKNSTIRILESQIREGEGGSGSMTNVGTPATFILEIVKQLDNLLPNLTNVFQLEGVEANVNANLRQLHANKVTNSIVYPFIDAFDAEVRHRGSLKVRKYLIEQQGFKELNDENQSIEEFSVNFLFNTGVVDVVLMGMTREIYVDFGRKMLKMLSDKQK